MVTVARSVLALSTGILLAVSPARALEPELVQASDACTTLTGALEKSGDAMAPVTLAQAREYQRQDNQPACRLALQRIDLRAAPSTLTPAPAPPPVAAEAPAPPAAEQPPSARTVTVSQLKPLAVWNATERLGDVRRIADGPDGKRYVLLAAGGFLGIGERIVAVPMESLRHIGDRLLSPLGEADIRALPDVPAEAAYRDLPDSQTVEMRP